MKKKTSKKEFAENRTSWKYFQNEMQKNRLVGFPLVSQLLLEVLKELQHLNDKRK